MKGGKKKKNRSNVNKEKAEAPLAFPTSSAIDYNQPEISPYEESRITIIIIGNKRYSIPGNYIQGHPIWKPGQIWDSRIILNDIDPDIGHTILHFLYKGEYETTASPGIQFNASHVELEYNRSIQVYYAARKYGIEGLETLAQKYIETLSESLSIFQILRGVKKIFPRLSNDEIWFHDYLHSQLSNSFVKDETTFQLDEFYNEIIDDPAFSKAVMKTVVRLFTVQLSCLRNPLEATDSGSEVDNEAGEFVIHEVPEAAPEEEEKPIFNGSPVEGQSVEKPTAAPCYEERCPEPEFEPEPAEEDYEESCPEAEPEPAEEYYEELCPEVPPEEYCIEETPSALDDAHPREESPIEPVPIQVEEPVPKVHLEQGDNDGWGLGVAGLKAKKSSLLKREKRSERHLRQSLAQA